MTRRFTVMMMVLVLFVATFGTSALAQDDEQQALIDRVFDAAAKLDEYNSYRRVSSDLMSMSLVLNMAGQEVVVSQTSQVDSDGQFILGDDMNVNATATAEYDTSTEGLGQSESSNYSLNAEVRVVDGIMYVNASYESSEGDVPMLPMSGEWVEVEDVDEYQIFDVLNLDDYLEIEAEIFEDREAFLENVADVTVEASELEDGTPVDIITIEIAPDLFNTIADMGGDSGDPMQDALAGLFANDSLIVLTAVLGEDNTPYEVTIQIDFSATEVDAASLSPDLPPGAGMDIELTMVTTSQFSDFDAEFEPAVSPME